MQPLKKDIIATCLVAVAGVVYLLWAADSTLPGMSSTRVAGVIVLALGFIASASAVVPTFDQLLHGNKVYLVASSLIGLVAFAGGLMMLVSASSAGFAVVIVAMVVLWMMSTIHHVLLAKHGATDVAPRSGGRQRPPVPRGRHARAI